MTFDVVHCQNVLKLFGPTRALSGVTLSFRRGEVTVLEGPNGSGKSTLLALLAGMSKPTQGRVLFGDHDSRRLSAATRRRIGVLSHKTMLYPELSGRENLEFFGRLYMAGDRATRQQRLTDLAKRFSLESFLDRPTLQCSRGQQQRLALARTLLHAPTLLLLDEPSTGLDKQASGSLWQTVREEQQRGAIVIVVSHDPGCGERLGARRVHLRKGRVVDVDDPGAAS